MWLVTLLCLFPIAVTALTGRERFNQELTDKAHFDKAGIDGVEYCRYLSKEINMLEYTPKAALRNVVGRSMDILTNNYHFTVFAETFENCLFTPDNRFIVPDSYHVEAIYDRKIDKSTSSSSSEHAKSEGSSDGASIGASGKGFKGSLSTTHSKNKKELQKNSKTEISMSVTNKMYIVTIDRASKFSTHFEHQLQEIKDAVREEFYDKARYLTQIMLADYGTEVTTRATVGSKITYTSFIESSYMESEESHQTEIKLSGSYEKKGKGKAEVSGSLKHGESEKKSSSRQAMETSVTLVGGGGIKVLKGANALDDLLKDDIPVAIETETMPIYMFLLDGNVTDMTSEQRLRMRILFEDATNEFIERNTIPGCTNSKFINYDYQANVFDNTCVDIKYCRDENPKFTCREVKNKEVNVKKMSTWPMAAFINCLGGKKYRNVNGIVKEIKCGGPFNAPWGGTRIPGGIYQTCTLSPETVKFNEELKKIGSGRDNLCNKFRVSFTPTKLNTCPENTEKQEIIKYIHTLPDTIISKKKFDCGFSNGRHRCNATEVTITLKDRLTIEAYWCHAKSKENDHYSAVYFGGYFDPGQFNNFIGQSACSDDMKEIRLFHGTTFCVSHSPPGPGESPDLTRLFNNDDERPYCDGTQSKQLITVVNGIKIYACILKKTAYYNLDAPRMIKGPFLSKRVLDEHFTTSMLEIKTGNNTRSMPLDKINNNFAEYLQRHYNLFKNESQH